MSPSAVGVKVPRHVEVVVEPGRALTANAALTLYRVGSIKRTPGGPAFAAVDGGMSDNIRPALYGVLDADGAQTAEIQFAPRSGGPYTTLDTVTVALQEGAKLIA